MKARLLPAATGVVVVSALVSASLALAGGTTLHLTGKANGKSFAVQRHEAIVVTLKSCGDCGYQWKRGKSSSVKVVSHKYVQHNKPGEVGGMGKEIWHFKVVGMADAGKIELKYVGPGSPQKVARRFKVELTIS